MPTPFVEMEFWEFDEEISEKYGEDHGFRFTRHQYRQSRQAVKRFSSKKLKYRLNDPNPYLKEIARLEHQKRKRNEAKKARFA